MIGYCKMRLHAHTLGIFHNKNCKHGKFHLCQFKMEKAVWEKRKNMFYPFQRGACELGISPFLAHIDALFGHGLFPSSHKMTNSCY